MSKTKKFVVVDVEGYAGVKPYNIGFIVADRNGKIYKKYSFAVLENVSVNILQANKTGQAIEMTARNIEEILKDTGKARRKRKYKSINNSEFKKLFFAVLKKYKVEKIYAYNSNFDKNSFKHLFETDFEKLDNMVEWIDIIPLILRTKLLTKRYCNFCISNGFVTEKGNIMTKAEIVYKYLKNDLTFEEEHTGLNDVLIEYEILLEAFKTRKKMDSTPCQAWRELKKFCDEKNIVIA